MQVFINGRWVSLHTVYAPANEPHICNEDVSQQLLEVSHEDVILLGDFNTNTRDGLFDRNFAESE